MLTEYQMIPSIHVYTTSCLNHNKHTYVLKYVYHFIVVKKNHLIILGFGRHTLNYQPPVQSHAVLHSTPFTVYYRNMQGRGRGVQQGKPPTGEGQQCPAREALPWNLQLSLGNLKVSCRAHPASSPFSTPPAVLPREGQGGLLTLLRSLFQVT